MADIASIRRATAGSRTALRQAPYNRIKAARTDAAERHATMQRFEASADGQTRRIASGEEFELALAENPTTGFRWALLDLPAFLSLIDDDFSPAGTSQPGAGGMRRWRLRADAAGRGTLRADLRARTPRQASPTGFALEIEARPAEPVSRPR
jgi:predicted secreted protein